MLCPGLGERQVENVDRHPTADIALLVAESPEDDSLQPFRGYLRRVSPGHDVTIYGFSADTFGPDPDRPVPRVLRTYAQRVMQYNSPLGFAYEAVELGISCPAGVSGGAILIDDRVAAIAAESQASSTVVDSIETTTRDGAPMTTVYQRVIEYGIGVELYPIRDWIRGHF